MKRILFLAGLAVAAGFTSCTSDMTSENVLTAHGDHTIKGEVVTNETRTQLGDKDQEQGTTPILWSENDALMVIGSTGDTYKYILEPASAGQKNGTFRVTEGDGAKDQSPVTAFYPYANFTYTQELTQMTLPVAQTYVAGRTFATNMSPMYTVSENPDLLKFHHMAGVINLQLTSLNAEDTGRKVTKIELESAGNQLSGTFNVVNAENIYSLVSTDKTNNKITLNGGEGVELSQTPSCFLFVVPAGIYSAGDLKFNISITATDPTKIGTKTLTVTNPLTIAHGQIVNFKSTAMPNIVVATAATPAEVENSITDALSNATIDENTTLHVKVETLTSTDGGTAPAITLPNSFDTPEKQAIPVTIELPAIDASVTSITLTADATNAPQQVTIVAPTTADPTHAFTIEMPASTVTLNGTFNTINASTAENTLVIQKGCIVKELTVTKGNVNIYGLVETIIKASEKSKISRYISVQAGLDQALAEGDLADYLYFSSSSEILDGKNATLTKNAVITGNTQISNLTLKPTKLQGVTNRNCILTIGTLDSNVTDVTLDNVDIYPSATMNRGLVIGDYPKSLNVTVKNSYIHVPNSSNVRAINIFNDANESHNFTCTLSLDNVHIGPTQEKVGDRELTDAENTAFKLRSDTRGVNIATHNVTANITNTVVEGVFYVINTFSAAKNMTLNVDNSTLDGRAAFNCWSTDGTITMNNSTLIGRNPFLGSTEVFATIVFVGDNSKNNEMTVTDSKIISYNAPQTATNYQFSADLRSKSDKLHLKGTTELIERGDARLSFMVKSANDSNTITAAQTVTIAGMEGATVVPMITWDGKTITKPMADVDQDYPIYGANELAWIAQQINAGNKLYVDHKTTNYPAPHYSTVYLENNLDLGNHPWQPIGSNDAHSFTVSSPNDIPGFYGEFAGQKFSISNINVDKTADAKGLFGSVKNGAKLHGIVLRNVNIPKDETSKTAGKWVGGLTGVLQSNASVENCHVDGITIYAPNMYRLGGLIGMWIFDNSTTETATEVKNCSVKNATITGGFGMGGLIGTLSAKNKVVTGCSVDNISIRFKDQHKWPSDYVAASGYCFAASALIGDCGGCGIANIIKPTIGTWSLYNDDDNSADYLNVTWAAQPYVGELDGTISLEGEALTKKTPSKELSK